MSRTNPRLNFAPVSSVPSSLVRFAGGYFVFNGVTIGILVILAVVARWIGKRAVPLTLPNIVVLLAMAVSGAGFVWTGIALWSGRRIGGWILLGLALLPIVGAVLTGQKPDASSVVFGAIELIILALVWRDLN
ncbi:MAG TPA: hypothetical protein VLJ83_04960 [Gemmatimonadaceae bacterium]|nr:hypothetical protein [Gemmatimonadaceae bacterium]